MNNNFYDNNDFNNEDNNDNVNRTEDNYTNYSFYDYNQPEEDTGEEDIVYDSGFGGGDEPPKNKKGNSDMLKKFMQLTASALVFGIVAGTAFQGVNYATGRLTGNSSVVENIGSLAEEDKNNVNVVNTSANNATTDGDVSDVVENVMPSIVSIKSTAVNQVQDFFGRVYDDESTGSGSGIIIGQNDKEVLIATNNHVIDGATSVEITFNDGKTAKAEVKGTDSSADLAVVSVQLGDLSQETLDSIKIATLGDSTKVKPGEMAIAIGNALGYGQSVTVGYISATEREISLEDGTMTLLQTDAAINPGNSGGALLNAKGEVIGINSIKFAGENVEGMGYAIPISDAVPIITDLMNREIIPESEQAYLGIIPQTVTKEYSERFNMPVGVYVYEVTNGSPADKAGLKEGDIIVGLDQRDASSAEVLQELLSYKRSGEKAVFTVKTLENGEYVEKEVEVTLGSKTASGQQQG